MGKGFFLFFAVLWCGLCWAAIFMGESIDDYAMTMFVLNLGIYSIMKLVERRTA